MVLCLRGSTKELGQSQHQIALMLLTTMLWRWSLDFLFGVCVWWWGVWFAHACGDALARVGVFGDQLSSSIVSLSF